MKCSRYTCQEESGKKKYCSQLCINLSKLKTTAQLKKAIWRIRSEEIRLRDADSNGYVNCYTCGKLGKWNDGDMHAGHYEHGYYPGTWLRDENLHTQCSQCNTHKGGNRNIYAIKLEQQYGHGILQELAKRHPPLTWTIPALREEYIRIYTKPKMSLTSERNVALSQ